MEPKVLINTLKQLLEDRGMTGYRFAKETGISQRTTYDLLNHPQIIPNKDSMSAICRTLNCQPGDFLTYLPEEKTEDEAIT